MVFACRHSIRTHNNWSYHLYTKLSCVVAGYQSMTNSWLEGRTILLWPCALILIDAGRYNNSENCLRPSVVSSICCGLSYACRRRRSRLLDGPWLRLHASAFQVFYHPSRNPRFPTRSRLITRSHWHSTCVHRHILRPSLRYRCGGNANIPGKCDGLEHRDV